jgi:hypothetical protein
MDAKERFATIVGIARGLTQGVQTVAPGLSPTRMAREVGTELKRQLIQGSAELAQALYTGHAFVPYGAGQQLNTQQQQHMQQMARGGRSM